MLKFSNAIQAWNTDAFSKSLKQDIEALEKGVLPLEKGTTQGGLVDDSNITATIMSFSENENSILVKAGVFFTEVIGGCSCGDDPITENAYCEIKLNIDKTTAEAEIDVILG